MHKKIYVNGSSFSDGYGLCKSNFLEVLHKHNPLYPNPNLPKEERVKFRQEHCWPGQLSKLVASDGVEVYNEAVYGGSFSRCVRMCFDYIMRQGDNPQDTLYILEIPNADRIDVFSTEKREHIIAGGADMNHNHDKDGINKVMFSDLEMKALKYYYTAFSDMYVAWQREILQMLGFASFLKLHGCDFLFIPMESYYPLVPYDEMGEHKLEDKSRSVWGITNVGQEYVNELSENFVPFEVKGERGFETCLCRHKWPEGYTDNILHYVNYNKFSYQDETNGELNDGHITLKGNEMVAKQVYEKVKKIWKK